MFQWEKKGLEWIERHLCVIAFVAVTIIGVMIRLSLRNHVSVDAEWSLLPWYNRIARGGRSKP